MQLRICISPPDTDIFFWYDEGWKPVTHEINSDSGFAFGVYRMSLQGSSNRDWYLEFLLFRNAMVRITNYLHNATSITYTLWVCVWASLPELWGCNDEKQYAGDYRRQHVPLCMHSGLGCSDSVPANWEKHPFHLDGGLKIAGGKPEVHLA